MTVENYAMIREKNDRFLKLCSMMKDWYDSRVALLPSIKNLLSKCFVTGVDDIIYKYTEPTIHKTKEIAMLGEIQETFQMFNVMLEYYYLPIEGGIAHYVIHWFNDEIIIVYNNRDLHVHKDRRNKTKLDEVYNYIIKQIRPGDVR